MTMEEFKLFLKKENISYAPRNGYILLYNSVMNFGKAAETEDGLIFKSNQRFFIPIFVSKLNVSTLMHYLNKAFNVQIYLVHGVIDE